MVQQRFKRFKAASSVAASGKWYMHHYIHTYSHENNAAAVAAQQRQQKRLATCRWQLQQQLYTSSTKVTATATATGIHIHIIMRSFPQLVVTISIYLIYFMIMAFWTFEISRHKALPLTYICILICICICFISYERLISLLLY